MPFAFKSRLLTVGVIGLGMYGTTPDASGALVAGDSYQTLASGGGYTPGTNLGAGAQPTLATDTSFGFTGFYAGSTTNLVTQTTTITNAATGYAAGAAGSVRLNAGSGAVGGAASSRSSLRSLASYTGAPTYYFSGLINATARLSGNQALSFEFSNRTPASAGASALAPTAATAASTARGFSFGIQGAGTDTANTASRAVLSTADGASVVSNTISTAYNTAGVTGTAPNDTTTGNLFIVKVNVDAVGSLDTFTVYLNPTDVTSEAQAVATAASTFTVNADVFSTTTTLTAAGLNTASANGNGANVITAVAGYGDELRFGTAFSNVVSAVAVPEPVSLAAIGLGGLVLGRRRRGA